MPFYSLRPVGFPEKEQTLLESLLTLARGMLHDVWQWTTDGAADVYLVAVESLREWGHYQAEFSQDRLLVYAASDLEIDTPWLIRRNRESLPSLRMLAQMLNAISAELGSASVHLSLTSKTSIPAGATPPAETAVAAGLESRVKAGAKNIPASSRVVVVADGFYDPDKYLIGVIRDGLADGVPRRLTCADGGGGAVLVEPGREVCCVYGDKALLWPLLVAPRDRIREQRFSDKQPGDETAAEGSHEFTFGEVLFLSALLGSQGRLWAGCRHDEPVRLKQWPNLRHLPHYMDYIGLMAFMSSNTADVKSIAERTGASRDKVINFHNACAALDLLDRGGEISIREKSLNPDMRDLYSKIAKRLHNEV
jgi:hypothetical protein